MPARRRTTFPGLDPRASKEIIALQDDLLNDAQLLRQEAIGTTTDTKQSGTYAVKFNERVRTSPGSAGVDLTFPGATPQNQNKWLEVLVLRAGNVRLRATSGLVQNAALFTLTDVGFYYFQSDGLTGWLMQPTGSSGGIADGVYGSITVSGGGTVFRITDGVYGGVTVSGGGLTWTVAGGGLTLPQIRRLLTLRAGP